MKNTVRFEKAGHGLNVGDDVRVTLNGRVIRTRVTGFESYEGSGLVFTDGLVRVQGIDYPLGWGLVTRVGHAFEEIPGAHSGQGMGNVCRRCGGPSSDHKEAK